MGIALPKGVNGTVKIDANYSVGSSKKRLTGQQSEETIEWNSIRSVEFSIQIEYQLFKFDQGPSGQEARQGEGRFGVSAKWNTTFADGGMQLEKAGVQPRELGTRRHEGMIGVAASARIAESKPGAKQQYIELTLAVTVAVADPGINVSAGFMGIGGSRNMFANQLSATTEVPFKISFEVKNKPEDESPVKIPPSLLTPAPIFFKEDEDILSTQSLKELHAWVSKIKDLAPLGSAIILGELPIEIQAFASTTGTEKYNKQETDRRLESVKKTLKRSAYFGSTLLKFDQQSHGMSKADSRGAADPYNRRVEIKIDRARAIKAVQKMVAGR